MEFLRQHQLNIMLIMSSICGMLVIFVLFTRTLPKRRRTALLLLESSAMLLLIADRLAYIYRGNVSTLGYWMVRISNFSVFFLSLFLLFSLTLYLIDFFMSDGKLAKIPKRLQITQYLFFLDLIILISSQFTGFLYTFDEFNRYKRSNGFLFTYIIPFTMLVLQFSLVIQHFKKINRNIAISLLLFTILPVIATAVQIFTYGLSLTNMTLVGDAVLFYVFVILDLNDTIEKANKREIELLKEEQKSLNLMFVQTAEALASAIDAKDKYTHGHSTRVAEYSREIARRFGKSERECEEVYFAALLHDVGKIGVSDTIINKNGKLTDEEYSEMKKHPSVGRQILANIIQSPYISVGAHYHHERFDGRGYPLGLKGTDIPEIARIIAVADSYDAMTSKRSYRSPLPQEHVRSEIERGVGTQFDPAFAKIMLKMIDEDSDYKMRETENVTVIHSL